MGAVTDVNSFRDQQFDRLANELVG